MNPEDVVHCEIHPTIGIARLGNSPDGFFVGPEAPGIPPRPDGGFKDASGRVKRQAARFRVYAYDGAGRVLGELTSADAQITWTAELANAKGAWFAFAGRFHTSTADSARRNRQVDPADPVARARLVVRPGPRSVAGPSADGTGARFDTGTFLGTPVPLGELRTDEAGRLLVLGGFGRSGSVEPAHPVRHFANNDSWFDDTSDGPVTATVRLGGPQGREVPVTPAWCLVTPPDFAPYTPSLITLYDVALEVARTSLGLPTPPEVSFTRDIYPLLARPIGLAWVNEVARRRHGDAAHNFLSPGRLARLSSNAAADAPFRQAVFRRLRAPGGTDVSQANDGFMPLLAGDDGDSQDGRPGTWLALLPGQYERMRRWAAGDFLPDGTAAPTPVPFADLTPQDQPHALVRAALEAANGGGFFPGIEMTYIAAEPATWAAPFRLRTGLAAGDISKYMAVPWQADFFLCNTHWWPAARPDEVLPEPEHDALLQVSADAFREWDRGIADGGGSVKGMNEMVSHWGTLGFIVARTAPDGGEVLVETERSSPDPP
ncbi:LodA/GoxA family CTQ-dependent oxidase [Kitasatospora sp. CM 4170]|uniref:LodA/GoxA family CTQ-dependent oxidase n=1 Tax=Kitasatospora aburaviensis TaxID=67265 RepID=A0ABW1EZI3_9ACTN|nr:LodA/GoxA family CTQ-dependent oxidase [Kitasatospora sp. CM 4170]WNM43531.1 LodA/GoxA family CTQ-dependent oxidase [Kitasatospora sp. CM 4170]